MLRGPSTLLYGNSAIGGTVNVIGKKMPRQRVDSKGYDGGVETRYDNVSEGKTFLGYTTVGQEDWALTVTDLDRDADHEIPDGAQEEDAEGSTLENSFLESEQFNL